MSGYGHPVSPLGGASLRSERPSPAPALIMLLWLCALVALCLWRALPPAPAAATAPAGDFSEARALHHLASIARQPHPTGSAENQRVREYLLGEWRKLGLTPAVQEGVALEPRGEIPRMARVSNLLARIPGTGPPGERGTVLLAAHYDSVPTGPGAADDGVGVAALLETARALKSSPPLRNDILILLTDGEELGLLGARVFIERMEKAYAPAVVLNLEARGAAGPVFMFETSDGGSGGNQKLIAAFARAAPRPLASSLMYSLYQLLPNDTDLTIFRQGGIAGLNFACVDGWNRYHTAADTLENLAPGVAQHQGEYALSLARELGNADLAGLRQPDAGDAVYFDLLGLVLLHYPQTWVWPLTTGAVVLYVLVLAAGLVRGYVSPGGVTVGVILGPVCLAAAGAGAFYLWHLVVILQPGFRTVPWNDPYNRGWFEAGFTLLALAVFSLVYGLCLRRFPARSLALGGLIWWLALLVASSLSLPGASYAFLVPSLLGVTSVVVLYRSRESLSQESLHPLRYLALLLTAMLPLALWVVLIRGMWMLLSANRPYLGPCLTILLALVLLPQLAVVLGTGRGAFFWAALLLGVGCTAAGVITFKRNPEQPGINSLFYVEGSQEGKAVWGTVDTSPDPWVSGFLKKNPREAAGGTLLPWVSGPVTVGDASPVELPAPEITLEAARAAGESGVQARFRIRPPAGTLGLSLAVSADSPAVESAEVDGVRLPVSRGHWSLQYLGPLPSGIAVSLTFARRSPTPILFADSLYDGFSAPPGEKPPVRPADRIATPRTRFLSDFSLSRRQFDLLR